MRAELLKVINEYLSLGIDRQLDYDKFYLDSIITNSTAIAESTATEIENHLIWNDEIIKKGGQKTKKGGQKKWSETALKILDLIKQDPKISRRTLSEVLQINPSAVQKHITKLKEAKLIERIGGAKGGEWKVND